MAKLCSGRHVCAGPSQDYACSLHAEDRSPRQPPLRICAHARQRTLEARVKLGGRSCFTPSALQRQYVASRPELVQQWHPTKHGLQTPEELTLGSRKTVWWLCTACPCGHAHEWQARVSNRVLLGRGCPVCAGKRSCACSSLAACRPDIARQWDPAGNDGLTPEEVTVASNRQVQWVCTKHVPPYNWMTMIYHRTRQRNPTGCPACANQKGKPKQRRPSLAEGCLPVAAQWHPSLNDTTPADVTCGANHKVWWLCKAGACGHEHVWQARVDHRVNGSGCPICAGNKPCVCTSLAAVHPDIVQQQWDFELNTTRPEDLLAQSGKEVHWRCSLHQPPHTWTATPHDRFGSHDSGCPACALDRRRTLKALGYH